jgi:hypothetical protein
LSQLRTRRSHVTFINPSKEMPLPPGQRLRIHCGTTQCAWLSDKHFHRLNFGRAHGKLSTWRPSSQLKNRPALGERGV